MGAVIPVGLPPSQERLDSVLADLRIRIGGRLQLGFYRESLRFGLRRDIRVSIHMPKAKIPIAVRPMVLADLPHLLTLSGAGPDERLDIARRRAFAARYPSSCFVAIDQRDGSPCYMQWLIGAADNHLIRRMGGFPELQPGEALLENTFTPARYRRLGIMSEAMALIAERGRELGADFVLTFVEEQNIASLKGCQRAGFAPHVLHHRAQLGFGILSRDTFETLADVDPRRTMQF